MKDLAVILLSGGLDSCVTTAIAAENHAQLALLHLNYGQRTQKREMQAFFDIAAHYKVDEAQQLIVDLPSIAQVGGSSLLKDGPAVPDADLNSAEIPSTYVPFRNGQILAIAAGWAEVIAARAIYVGAVEEDSSGYPDCRRSFFDAFAQAINQGTKPGFAPRIETPLINLSKAQIVQRGIDLKAPMHLSWSCYTDSERACGQCESCLLRLRGFAQAGIADPIPYRS